VPGADPRAGALGGLGDHLAKEAAEEARPAFARVLLDAYADAIAGSDARLYVGDLHAGRTRDEVLHHLQQLIAQHVALADPDGDQLHAFVMSGTGGGHLSTRLLAARF